MTEEKKYILIKNMPNCKAGTIFSWDQPSDRYKWSSGNDHLLFRKESVENNPEWFDEIEIRWSSAICSSTLHWNGKPNISVDGEQYMPVKEVQKIIEKLKNTPK